MDKTVAFQIKTFREKISQLQRELDNRKNAGERKIQKAESELRLELDRIQEQINGYSNKVKILEDISNSKAEEKK